MRHDSGFTLLELVVVCAIIGILAALAIPNYAMFKANAKDATAASDTRNIAPAAQLALSENKLPPDDVLVIDNEFSGPIPELPGATSSPGVGGTVSFFPDEGKYIIDLAFEDGGTLNYTLDSDDGLTISDR